MGDVRPSQCHDWFQFSIHHWQIRIIKVYRGYDIETLYQAIIKNTKGPGSVSSVGRLGADYYNDLGYIPYDVGVSQNSARTLEYAYDDFCIWQLAKALKRPQDEIDLFAQRANEL